jgi:hypothetical protein
MKVPGGISARGLPMRPEFVTISLTVAAKKAPSCLIRTISALRLLTSTSRSVLSSATRSIASSCTSAHKYNHTFQQHRQHRYHITSHHITSHHITSHHITSHEERRNIALVPVSPTLTMCEAQCATSQFLEWIHPTASCVAANFENTQAHFTRFNIDKIANTVDS